jgi:hypothetical protein
MTTSEDTEQPTRRSGEDRRATLDRRRLTNRLLEKMARRELKEHERRQGERRGRAEGFFALFRLRRT